MPGSHRARARIRATEPHLCDAEEGALSVAEGVKKEAFQPRAQQQAARLCGRQLSRRVCQQHHLLLRWRRHLHADAVPDQHALQTAECISSFNEALVFLSNRHRLGESLLPGPRLRSLSKTRNSAQAAGNARASARTWPAEGSPRALEGMVMACRGRLAACAGVMGWDCIENWEAPC